MFLQILKNKISLILYITTTILFISSSQFAHAKTQFNGVNLAGADFGTGNLPGTFNTDYTYPTHQEVDYFISKGMNVFRLPFMWERIQNDQNGPLNQEELARIKDFVAYATSKQARVILDPHNGARYYGEVIGLDGDQGALPEAAFKDLWIKLAAQFKDNDKVIFGLMNEPNEMPSELWRDDANAAIVAIRSTGASNLILVPGNAWTGAHSWSDDSYGTPNATVMKEIVDSANNYAIEVHQYMDSDSSGTSANCVSETIGSQRLVGFTDWLRANNVRGFLGEFAGGRNDKCLKGLDNMLDYMDANDDVWLGWTYWAAGPWWGEDIFTLEPKDGVDRPQMAALLEHISSGEQTTDTPNSAGSSWYKPTPLTTLHWQLQGTINTAYDVDIYDIDLFDTEKSLIQELQASGKKVICYFSGGSYEEWRSDAGQFAEQDLGKALDGWAGERWLDIRSTGVRNIMKSRLDLASQKGCDGVEADNMDGYTNDTNLPLNANDQLNFNRFIASEAHKRGLAVGLKNDLDQIEALVNDFDFAVNEQCFQFNECDLLAPFIEQNKAVFNVEYSKQYVDDTKLRKQLCDDAQQKRFTTLVLPLLLDDSFRLSCQSGRSTSAAGSLSIVFMMLLGLTSIHLKNKKQ